MQHVGQSLKAVFLDHAMCGEVDLTPLKKVLSHWQFFSLSTHAEAIQRAQDADIIVNCKVQIDSELIQSTKSLKLVCVTATGFDNVDASSLQSRNIALCNVAAYSTESVVQHVFSLLLALKTKLIQYHQAVQNGAWQKSQTTTLFTYPIEELYGKTLGIIGFGNIGQRVSEVAKTFGMSVIIAEHPHTQRPRAGRTPFQKFLSSADVITIHCPLNEKTRNLINTPAFNLMKPSALLINTARGGIINESDLADALLQERIAGAGIDVLSQEPPTKGNPLLDLSLPNLIITPHTAWASHEARQRVIDETAENINAFLNHRQRNRVM